jgi:hypothetical protein
MSDEVMICARRQVRDPPAAIARRRSRTSRTASMSENECTSVLRMSCSSIASPTSAFHTMGGRLSESISNVRQASPMSCPMKWKKRSICGLDEPGLGTNAFLSDRQWTDAPIRAGRHLQSPMLCRWLGVRISSGSSGGGLGALSSSAPSGVCSSSMARDSASLYGPPASSACACAHNGHIHAPRPGRGAHACAGTYAFADKLRAEQALASRQAPVGRRDGARLPEELREDRPAHCRAQPNRRSARASPATRRAAAAAAVCTLGVGAAAVHVPARLEAVDLGLGAVARPLQAPGVRTVSSAACAAGKRRTPCSTMSPWRPSRAPPCT